VRLAGGRACEDRPVVPGDFHEFFAATAGVAGALIGLLFVAISVSAERLAKEEASAQVLRIRAYAALTSFTNALVVSLWALIPDQVIGVTSAIMGTIGLLFIAASLLSLVRMRQVRAKARDAILLIGLVTTFAVQLAAGIQVILRPGDSGSVETIGILVIVCFLIGIARAWELIGGPSIGIGHEVFALVRGEEPAKDGAETAADSSRAEDPPPL
jgi:hypothetical protein